MPMSLRAIGLALLLLLPSSVAAQDGSLSVTVTPPLFQLAIGPGDEWSSVLKIVNKNPYDVTYYAEVMDFEARGELGKGEMIPIVDEYNSEDNSFSLASWVTIPTGAIVVPGGQSGEVPFTVKVPPGAEPGGHYAAILVGTQPDLSGSTGSRVAVSSYVTSLLFVKIHGDVDERGRVREFFTKERIYQVPMAEFVLRFENIGNVHLKPEGNISIYNMWGKSRGTVSFNQRTAFGNVLPKSTRRFEFTWQGEQSVFDIGRYSAVITLTYGEEGRQNISATTYFWVIPVVPVTTTLVMVFGALFILFWFIRRYVRRALQLERLAHGLPETAPTHATLQTFMKPLEEGVVDLRRIGGASGTHTDDANGQTLSFAGFVWKYSLFFIFVALFMAGSFGIWYYLQKVLVPERDFSVTDVRVTPEGDVSDSE